MKKYIWLIPFIFLFGCTSQYGTGYNYLNQRDYSSAYNEFLNCAKKGNSNCMNALGVLYLRGHIKAKNQREMAVSWFKFSARHGNATAINNLNLLNESIPPADLIPRKTRSEIEAESRAMDAWGDAAGTLGEVLGRSLF